MLRPRIQSFRYSGASGWNDAAVGHVIDIHDYAGVHPAVPNGTRASVLGEFGGLGLNLQQHTYQHGKNASSYLMFNTTEELNSKYLEYLEEVKRKMLDPRTSLSAIIYTELTDVEHEVKSNAPCQQEFRGSLFQRASAKIQISLNLHMM